jgi:hypothetical protein
LILICFGSESLAQRINFSTFVQGEEILLTLLDQPNLNFNRKSRVIVVGQASPVVINIGDDATLVVEIDAPIEYDITAELTWDKGLSINGSDTGIMVPFEFRFAYNNTGELTDVERRANAVQIPPMFHTITFPMRRRTAGGPPPPPPTPEHGGYVRPRGKAYLFFYGSLGPVPNNLRAGNYSGDIQLSISYADNTF